MATAPISRSAHVALPRVHFTPLQLAIPMSLVNFTSLSLSAWQAAAARRKAPSGVAVADPLPSTAHTTHHSHAPTRMLLSVVSSSLPPWVRSEGGTWELPFP